MYITGAYTADSVSVIALVSDVLNKGVVTEMRPWFGAYPMAGLLLMFLCRVALTLLGTNIMVPAFIFMPVHSTPCLTLIPPLPPQLQVPAGIFMPVHLIGGLLGRFVGYATIGHNSLPTCLPT